VGHGFEARVVQFLHHRHIMEESGPNATPSLRYTLRKGNG
jgi:hypothetical protein